MSKRLQPRIPEAWCLCAALLHLA